jgi:enterochelin esterase-like enzyme
MATVLMLAAAEVRATGTPLVPRAIASSFRSRALQSRLGFLVYLPAGYRRTRLRYPVVYFMQGLPAGPGSYQKLSWVAGALAATSRRAILVVPQSSRRQEPDPEYHDWGPGNDWATALSVELPAYIDSHFRTIASRAGRAVVGLSAGGYGAAVLGLHHPSEFSVIESWSGYFRPTDPSGRRTLDVGSVAENANASVHAQVSALPAQFRRYPTFLAFYIGRDDPIFAADNLTLDQELSAAGVPHVFALFAGAHSTSLWRGQAPTWLRMAVGHLARPASPRERNFDLSH